MSAASSPIHSNDAIRYGTVTKVFHWLTAALIVTAAPLGVVANQWPYETQGQLLVKAQLFSVHKTLGVTVFLVALLRIVWALTQTKPAPVHPDRRAETLLAETVHWALYASLVVVPLSGWIHHASSEGFAPILWPFGQSLPLVPKSPEVYAISGSIHLVFTKVLLGALALHVLGAMKHVAIDRDGTLQRMWFGDGPDPDVDPSARHRHAPAIAAASAIYAAGFVLAVAIVPSEASDAPAAPTLEPAAQGGWTVRDGTIEISIEQFGSTITGSFADWTAAIAFSEEPADGLHGDVTVEIAIPSLTLGSVTDQAMGADYFNTAEHPTARFTADIEPGQSADYLAAGTLDLAGATADVNLPFTLAIEGDTATMSGTATLDRRTFAIGEGTTDEGTLAFPVEVSIDLTAVRSDE